MSLVPGWAMIGMLTTRLLGWLRTARTCTASPSATDVSTLAMLTRGVVPSFGGVLSLSRMYVGPKWSVLGMAFTPESSTKVMDSSGSTRLSSSVWNAIVLLLVIGSITTTCGFGIV